MWMALLSHIEAIQTVDFPLIVQHISLVLKTLAQVAQQDGEADDHKQTFDWTGLQEVLVIYYLEAFGDALENLPEDRIMELYAEHSIAKNLISVLALPNTIYDRDTIIAAIRALNAVFDSEHFQSHSEKHLDEVDVTALQSLGAKFLDELCKDVKFRMSIRSLHDYMKRSSLKSPTKGR